MLDAHLDEIDGRISLLISRLRQLQNADHGFKAYYTHDVDSGSYTTSQILHSVSVALPNDDGEWLRNGATYLTKQQNPDGGWPFRLNGKSITDITAWACLALGRFGFTDAIRRGMTFVLNARENEGSPSQPGWGLTTFEPDRPYSTWIASKSLRVLRDLPGVPQGFIDQIDTVLFDVRSWLIGQRKPDGSWTMPNVIVTNRTNTALSLLTLFDLGESPANYVDSYSFLRGGQKNGYWNPERDLVVTREGYELTQEMFTSALCFEAIVQFCKAGVATVSDVAEDYDRFSDLVRADGSVTRLPGSSPDFVWTIPIMLLAVASYRSLVQSRSHDFIAHWKQKAVAFVRNKKAEHHSLLQQQFPYPISQAFFAFQHELDPHRQFQLLLQFYDVTLRYLTVVGLAGYLLSREQVPSVQSILQEHFRRPSLGDWAALAQELLQFSKGFEKLTYPVVPPTILEARSPYLSDRGPKATFAQLLSGIVSLRNTTLGHGAVKSVHEYKHLVADEQERLHSFIDRMLLLARSNSFLILAAEYDEFGEGDKYTIRVFKGLNIDDNQLDSVGRLSKGQEDTGVRYVYFQNTVNHTVVNLYPFISFMFCHDCKSESFFFFNGERNEDSIAYLSYECGHIISHKNRSHFQKRLRASGIEW